MGAWISVSSKRSCAPPEGRPIETDLSLHFPDTVACS
jgi:hypothetical protein